MNYWNDILATALVGTSRAPLPEVTADTQLGQTLAQLASQMQSPEHHVLAAGGTLALWQHAGAQSSANTFPMPPEAPLEGDNPCPPRAAVPLARMLAGEFSEVRAEYFTALKAHGYTLPHRWLPELLHLAQTNSKLKDPIMDVLGARGRWLAQQRSHWSVLVATPDPTTWDTADQGARFRIINYLRCTEPTRALSLLQKIWPQEKPDIRIYFLDKLHQGLSRNDEAFLESALDDRSKRVREFAAQILAQLPQSDFVRRMVLRARPYLKLQRTSAGKRTLTVELPPPACDKAMQRDGLSGTPPKGMGQRVWLLRQMLGVIPPSYWSDSWKLSPADLIALADNAEESALLLEAWAEATATHQDAAWANALIQRWNSKRNFAIMKHLPDLVALLPPESVEPWLESRLYWVLGQLYDVEDVQDDFGMLDLLKSYTPRWGQPWGEKLSRAVLDLAQLLATKRMRGPSPLFRWASDLSDFALYMAPSLASQTETGWPATLYYWSKSVAHLQATLHFRKEMYARLDEQD